MEAKRIVMLVSAETEENNDKIYNDHIVQTVTSFENTSVTPTLYISLGYGKIFYE